MNTGALKAKIIASLSDDLLNAEWRQLKRQDENPDPTFGHCYCATEAAYHLLGGKEAGWKPMHLRCQDGSHWFLKHSSGEIFDATVGQYQGQPIEYDRAKGKGFLTRQPSKRAQTLMQRLRSK